MSEADEIFGKPPREFIIQGCGDYECEWGQVVVELPGKVIEKDFKEYGKIHVIEYSAYEEIKKQLEKKVRHQRTAK